jgi:hypothetical protein
LIALCDQISKGSNDHRGGNDGNNAQVDMNYGTSLGRKSFINATASFQLRGQTGELKMLQVIYLMRLMLLSKELPKQELISIAYLVT